jgi:hypothetical protein
MDILALHLLENLTMVSRNNAKLYFVFLSGILLMVAVPADKNFL